MRVRTNRYELILLLSGDDVHSSATSFPGNGVSAVDKIFHICSPFSVYIVALKYGYSFLEVRGQYGPSQF